MENWMAKIIFNVYINFTISEKNVNYFMHVLSNCYMKSSLTKIILSINIDIMMLQEKFCDDIVTFSACFVEGSLPPLVSFVYL